MPRKSHCSGHSSADGSTCSQHASLARRTTGQATPRRVRTTGALGLCILRQEGSAASARNQAFIPVSDQVVLDHLQGRHVIGVYPLLETETCWFLAVDFGQGSWSEDVSAFRKTCESFALPVAIERSRSGNGAHAWFFFRGACSRERREANGLLPHHRNDEPAPTSSQMDRTTDYFEPGTRCLGAGSAI